MQMEMQIKDIRNSMAAQKTNVKIATDQINAVKQEIDALKSRLDKKEFERRAKNNQVDRHEDMFDERTQDNDVIDEEELMLLK